MSIIHNTRGMKDLVVDGRHMSAAYINGRQVWPSNIDQIPPPNNPDDKTSDWWYYGAAKYDSGIMWVSPDAYLEADVGSAWGFSGAVWSKKPYIVNDHFELHFYSESSPRTGLCILLSDRITGVKPYVWPGYDYGAVFTDNTIGIITNRDYTEPGAGSSQKYVAIVKGKLDNYLTQEVGPGSHDGVIRIPSMTILYSNGILKIDYGLKKSPTVKIALPPKLYVGFTACSTYYGGGTKVSRVNFAVETERG